MNRQGNRSDLTSSQVATKFYSATEIGRQASESRNTVYRYIRLTYHIPEQLAIEENKRICLSEAQILAFLDYVCEMPLENVNMRRAIINILIHPVYLYDDHFTLIINASKKPMSVDNIPLEETEEAFSSDKPIMSSVRQ